MEQRRDRLAADPPPVLRAGDGPICVARAPHAVTLLGGDVAFGGALRLSVPGAGIIDAAARRTDGVELELSCDGDGLDGAGLRDALSPLVATAARRAGHGGGLALWIAGDVTTDGGASPVTLMTAVHRAATAAFGRRPDIDEQVEDLLAAAETVDPWVHVATVSSAMHDRAGRVLPILCQPDDVCEALSLPDEVSPVILSAGAGWWYPSGPRILRTAAAIAYRLIAERVGLVVRTGERGAPQAIDDPFFEGYLANVDPVTFASEFRDHLPEHIAGADVLERWGGVADDRVRVVAGETYPVRQAALYVLSEHKRACVAVDALTRTAAADARGVGRVLGAQLEQAYLAERGFEWSGLEAQYLITELRRRGPDRGVLGTRSSAFGGPVIALVERGDDGERALMEAVAAFEREYGRGVEVHVGSGEGATELPVLTA